MVAQVSARSGRVESVDRHTSSESEGAGGASPTLEATSRPPPLASLPPPGADLLAGGGPAARPSGVDAASFAAGESAAFQRAFAAALPGQQALGQLGRAVDVLHARLEADAVALRALQGDHARAAAALASAVGRLDHVERKAVPELRARVDAVGPALSAEAADAFARLRDVLAGLSDAQARYLEAAAGYPGPAGFLVAQLTSLLALAVRFGSAGLARADVAAIFLSRRILVGDLAAAAAARRSRLQVAAGAALFVAAVEAAWQATDRGAAAAPAALRRAAAPLRVGMKAARAAVWAAAFVLAANEARGACAAAAGSVATSAEAAAAQLRSARGREGGAPPPADDPLRDAEAAAPRH
jgi:hypothetical protein